MGDIGTNTTVADQPKVAISAARFAAQKLPFAMDRFWHGADLPWQTRLAQSVKNSVEMRRQLNRQPLADVVETQIGVE